MRKIKKKIVVNDKMQRNYSYELVESMGENFAKNFNPELTPKQMLALGVFGGKYMTDCQKEFPKEWFLKAKFCSSKHDAKLNFFGINASQPLKIWRQKGWLHQDDPRGWFFARQLPQPNRRYCRHPLGLEDLTCVRGA